MRINPFELSVLAFGFFLLGGATIAFGWQWMKYRKLKREHGNPLERLEGRGVLVEFKGGRRA